MRIIRTPARSRSKGAHRTTIRPAASAVAATLLLLGVAPLPAGATNPGPNGRIAFFRWGDDGFAQVWTSNPDLTAEVQLTTGEANSGWPAWAPDASRIAFDSDRSDPDPGDGVPINDVFTMRPDGSDVRKLTDSVGFSGDPAYSPDGSLVAFDTNRGATSGDPGWPAASPDLSIFVINTDGTGMRRVTTPPSGASDTEPSFSPDGTRIVFTRFQGGHTFESGRVVGDSSALFTIRPDGTGLRQVTGWGRKAGQADWWPQGGQILFEQACCRFGLGGIYSVVSGGGATSAIVNGHGFTGIGSEAAWQVRQSGVTPVQVDGYYDPVWSPDGTRILAGREYLDDNGVFRSGLIMLNADGSDLQWVSPDVRGEHQPAWGTAPLQ